MSRLREVELNSARTAEAKSLAFDAIQALEEGNQEEARFLADDAKDLDEVTASAVLKQARL